MRIIILTFLLLSPLLHANEWSVPKNPDPEAILSEAIADRKAGLYKTALAKHIWFHENALSIQPSQYGVRLSFAISYWLDLGGGVPTSAG